jgi:hypothetical protein
MGDLDLRDSVSASSVVGAVSCQVSSRVADEVVVLNLQSGTYHGLEAVGARVWELIQTPVPVQKIRDAILSEYDAEPERCERELVELLRDMHRHQLLEVHPSVG